MKGASASDVELVTNACRGDATSLGALLERYRAPLYGVALIMLADRMRAEDAVQETFMVAMGRLGDLRDPAAVGAWLRTIIKNICRMELRRLHEIPMPLPDRSGVGLSVEAEIESLAVRDWVWTALGHLPEDVRTTMMLRHFTRRASYAEIAEVLGIPVGTVRSRLSQGRQYLADALAATAGIQHQDNAVLVQQRWQQRSAALKEMGRQGRAAVYFADCSAEVVVSAPALGYECRGTTEEQRNIEAGLAVGVRMRLVRILACQGMTIVEADYDNPPDSADHCPPWHTEIRIHPTGPTTRIVLHFGQRPISRP